MPSTDTEANPAFLEAEAELFARYGLKPETRQLQLTEPTVILRALELGSGEPALFMHGISLCTAHWGSLIVGLPPLRCIAVDMPGHGGSQGVDYGGVNLRRWHTNMLRGCLDELGIDSAHVIGHSYGAMFALWLALEEPQRVRSIVAIGTPAVAFGARPDLTLRLLSLRGIGALSLSMPSPRFVYRRVLARSLGRHAIDKAPPELIRATYLGTRRRGFARTVSTYLREQLHGARAHPQRYVLRNDELAQIHQPVLVIWGELDERYQPLADGQKRVSLMPNARFEVVPGGHEPWLDDPEPCTQLISAFLA